MFFPSLRSAFAGALVAASLANAAPQLESRATNSSACNNSPELCSRQYNKITHMGAHGSSFLRDAGSGIAAAGNQYKNATDALDAGLRLLQAQVHKQNSTLELCHTSCDLLDAGPLEDWLSTINDWMTANPDEVVTLLLVNSDEAKAAEFGSVFSRSGISNMSFTPAASEATSEWPTLQSMIDDKKRIVAFITNMDAASDYPYLIPEFDYVFETSFEVSDLTGFNCTLDRPSRADSATAAISNNWLGLVNHFKYQSLGTDIFLPDVSNIEIVNSADTTTDGNLGKHLDQCKSEWGVVPNFVLVDFFDKGDVIKATDNINEITDGTGRTNVTSDDESQAARGDRNMKTGALIAFLAAAVMMV
ncbi:Fc.00g111210.m01.CDS01 [Cosmosporella sp. VM-42]